MSQPVIVELPYFVGEVLVVLPQFLEAVGEYTRLMDIRKIEFNPDHKGEYEDPPKGQVIFYFSNGWILIFTVYYRPGEEGTRGSLDDIHQVELVEGEDRYVFCYIRHYCGCRYCPGRKYPFMPATMERWKFERMSDDELLQEIRQYIRTGESMPH